MRSSRIGIALVVAALGVGVLAGCSSNAHADVKPDPTHSAETHTAAPVTEINLSAAQLESVTPPGPNATPQQIGQFYINVDNVAWFGGLNENTPTIIVNEQMASIKQNGGQGDTAQQAAVEIATRLLKPALDKAIAPTSDVMDMNAYKTGLITTSATNMNADGNGKTEASWSLVNVQQQTTGLYLITKKFNYQHPDSNDTTVGDNGQEVTDLVGFNDAGQINLVKQESVTPAS